MFSHDRSPEGPGAFRLTPDCEVVQAEIAALVAALCARGAAEDEGRRARFLLAVRRIRQHLRDHLEGVEGVAGLFDAIALGAAQLMPQLTTLCEEHAPNLKGERHVYRCELILPGVALPNIAREGFGP